MIIFILAIDYIRQMMKNDSYRNIFRQQSTKSLNKFKMDNDGKPNHLGSMQRKREDSNLYTITTNTVNFASNKELSKKDEEYVKRIKFLEGELKKKINDDNVLRNLFKTKTSSELAHLDLFLEIRRLEQSLKGANERQKQSKRKISEMQTILQTQEQEHIRYIEMLSESIEEKERQWKAQKRGLQQQRNTHMEEAENYQFLLEEIKKKYAELNQKYKELNDELDIEREAKVLGELKENQEYQNQISSLMLEVQKQKHEIIRLKAQLDHRENLIHDFAKQIEKIKDDKQKLELRVKEFDEVSNDFNLSKRQEKERYKQYYQKLKVEYELQIESILKNHEEELKKQSIRISALVNQKSKLEEDNVCLNKKIEQNKVKMEALFQENKQILHKQQNTKDQLDALQGKSVKLSRQLLQIRYEKGQLSSTLQKTQRTFDQKETFCNKLQQKISELNSLNANLQIQSEEYKKQAEVNQSYLKINNKIYNDNFKTLGRLIEINNKIKTYLNLPKEQEKSIDQQSLGEVASYLTQLLQKFIVSYNFQKKKHQEFIRERNLQNRQILNLLEQCKQFISNQYAQNLLSRYIFLIKDRKNVNSEQSNNEKLEIYHELIENLMNLNSIKYYHSQHSNQQVNLKDSLQSTYLQRDVAQSNKKLSRHSLEKGESNKIIRRKERLSTQPLCDLPLKTQLFVQEENKENVSLNVNKNMFELHKEPKTYVNSVREKISSKFSERRGQSKNSTDFRSEIQKKYFRS